MPTTTGQTINQQTPGPLAPDVLDGTTIRADNGQGSILCRGSEWFGSSTEGIANARTLAAGFNLLDKTGRELGIDAATLGESVDLGALIVAARDVKAEHVNQSPGDEESPLDAAIYRLAHALSTLPAIP